jgi:hypothetical protein
MFFSALPHFFIKKKPCPIFNQLKAGHPIFPALIKSITLHQYVFVDIFFANWN